MGRLFDIQCILGQDDPGIIGIQMVTGEEGHAAEIDAYVAFADTFASSPHGNGGQRPDANIQIFKVVNLTHRAIDDNPFPLILYGKTRQSASINARRTEPPPSISKM